MQKEKKERDFKFSLSTKIHSRLLRKVYLILLIFFLQVKFPSPHGLLSFLSRGEYEVKIQFYCIFHIIYKHIVQY